MGPLGTCQALDRDRPWTCQTPARDMLGTCQGHARDLLGTCQGPVRDLLGTRQGPVRHLLGTPRDSLGTRQGPTRDLLGSCQVPVRDLLGTCQGVVRDLLRCVRPTFLIKKALGLDQGVPCKVTHLKFITHVASIYYLTQSQPTQHFGNSFCLLKFFRFFKISFQFLRQFVGPFALSFLVWHFKDHFSAKTSKFPLNMNHCIFERKILTHMC